MKPRIPAGLFLSFFLSALFFISCKDPVNPDVLFEKKSKGNKMDDIQGAIEYELELLKDPSTGRIPEGIHQKALLQARQNYLKQLQMGKLMTNAFTFQGPNNLGGRTRAIVYDARYNGSTNQVILAGGVSGGVYKSTDNGATWVRKSPADQHFSCTGIAQDTRSGNENTWYYSTGEAIGNSAGAVGAFYSGNGVYKSTDNGETWTRLTNSDTTALETFSTAADIINKIIVDPTNGNIFIACAATIRRSTDGGSTWSTVLEGTLANSGQFTDIAVTSTGILYAAFGGTNSNTVDGVWMSTTGGGSGSWTRIAGTGAATSPAGWNAQGTYGRVVLGIAPSNENMVYALYYNNAANPAIEADLFKWDNAAGTWTDLSANLPNEPGDLSGNDPFAVQGGYDLVVAVKPDNENVVFVGGTNLYRSTNGFTSTAATTRIGGYNSPADYSLYPNSHPDIHAIVFQPGSPGIMLCGNDGGIQRTTDVMAGTVTWTQLNTGYRTFQYYYVALDPRSGNDKVIGGAQDNGTARNVGGTGSTFELVFGGDGVSVGLSDVISGNTYEYVGSQSGSIRRRNSTSAPNFSTNIRPSTATGAGLFVTLFHLDPDNTQYLYYVNSNSLYRNASASTATTLNWDQMTGVQTTVGAVSITALSTTRGAYNASTASLFIGTNNSRVYRLDDPLNAATGTNPVNISTGLPASGYISSIAVNPRNDDTVLVTLSNYGVNSIWWTGNANSATPTWTNVERNINLPSIRSSVIGFSGNDVTYFVGTSVGLYSTDNPLTTDWMQEGPSDIGNAVVTSLAYRTSDRRLLVGTHGYGMWSTSLSMAPLPVTLESFKGSLQNQSALLEWITSSEQNTRNFDIEKSTDGLNYYKIGSVNAAGNSTTNRNYQFRDPRLSANNYYRLRTNDLDGKSKISNVVLVRYTAAKQNLWVMNNPFRDYIDLRFGNNVTKVSLQLVGTNGAVVAKSELNATGSGPLRWNVPGHLPEGSYVLSATVDGTLFTYKLIKQ